MSKDEFVLKINKVKVNFSDIKGGIKKDDIKNEKMKTIFDAIDTDNEKGVLSEEEVSTFFGLVKQEAQKHNSKNLGNREYKKLLQNLEKNGIKLENVDKKTFLQFLSDLKEAGKKPAAVEEEQKEEVLQGVMEEGAEENEDDISDAKTTEVVVQLGETPEKLAQKFGCSVQEIKELNKDKLMSNGKWFRAGDTVVIPKEIAPEELEGRKSSEEVNNDYRKVMANKRTRVNHNSNAAPNGKSNAPAAADGNKQKQADADKVKVTVPVAEVGVRTKQIEKYRSQGIKLTASLKKNDTKGLSVQNIAYAFTSEVKFQDMTEETKHFVFKYLVQRLKDLGISNNNDCKVYGKFSKLSKNEQNKILREYRNRIVATENKVWRADVNQVNKANAERPKAQKLFEDANEFIDNAAKGKVKPAKIDVGASNKAAEFEDGKKIEVFYDKDGTINSVNVFNKEPEDDNVRVPDVRYTADGVNVKNEHSKNTIKSGFDFEKIKSDAEKIFGKYNADDFKPKDVSEDEETADAAGEAPSADETQTQEETPADKTSQSSEEKPAPETEPKFTTEQIKTTVKFTRYSETQIKRDMEEGLKIATGEKGIETLNKRNVAYSIVHGDKYAGTKNAQTIFKNLVQRMIDLKIFENGKDYGSYASLSKLPLEKQDEIIHEYALRIRNKDSEHLNAPKEAAKQQKVFNEANKFLVDMANSKNHLGAKIELEEGDGIHAELSGPKGILVVLNSQGEIYNICYYDYSKSPRTSVAYVPDKAWVSTDVDDKSWELELTSGFNFNEIKKVAEAIFADFLKKNE